MDNQGLRILLVDDDEDDYLITRDLLSEIKGGKFKLEWVSTYDAALDVIRRNQHDVYLIDYRLGEHNGLELLYKATGNGYKSPMIILTGQGDHEVDVEAMKAGAADYLIKGRIDAAMLERSMRYAIEHKKALESLYESQRFFQSTFDALSAHIAILDNSGTIIAINEAWQRFMGANNFVGANYRIGMNYLEICESATSNSVEEASAIAR